MSRRGAVELPSPVNVGIFAELKTTSATAQKAGVADVKGAWIVCVQAGCKGEEDDQDPKGLRMAVARSERDAAVIAAYALKAAGQALSSLQKECLKKSEPGTIKTFYQFSMSNAKGACGWDNRMVKTCWSSKKKIDEFSTEEFVAGGGPSPENDENDGIWDKIIADAPGLGSLQRAVDFEDGEYTGTTRVVESVELMRVGPKGLQDRKGTYAVQTRPDADSPWSVHWLPGAILAAANPAPNGAGGPALEGHPMMQGTKLLIERVEYSALCGVLTHIYEGDSESVRVHYGVLWEFAKQMGMNWRGLPGHFDAVSPAQARQMASWIEARLSGPKKPKQPSKDETPRKLAQRLGAEVGDAPPSGDALRRQATSGGAASSSGVAHTQRRSIAFAPPPSAIPPGGVDDLDSAYSMMTRGLSDELKARFNIEANEQLGLELSASLLDMPEVVAQSVNRALALVPLGDIALPDDSTLPAACVVLLKLKDRRRKRPDVGGGGETSTQKRVVPRVAYVTGAGDAKELDPEQEADACATRRILEAITANNATRDRLSKVADMAEAADYVGLRTAVANPDFPPALTRLMQVTANISSTSPEAIEHADVVHEVQVLRLAWDKMATLVAAAGSDGERDRASSFQLQAQYIRRGQFPKLSLAKLVGKTEKASANALAFLDAPKHASGEDGLEGRKQELNHAALLTDALNAAAQIFSAYNPGMVSAGDFFGELRTTISNARADGLSYTDIGEQLWVPLMAQLRARVARFARAGTVWSLSKNLLDESILGKLKEAQLRVRLMRGGSGGAPSGGVVSEEDPDPGDTEAPSRKQKKKKRSKGDKPAGGGAKRAKTSGDGAGSGTVLRAEDPQHRITATRSLADVAKLIGAKDKLCSFFHSDKGCKKGKQCTWAHEGRYEKVG